MIGSGSKAGFREVAAAVGQLKMERPLTKLAMDVAFEPNFQSGSPPT